MLEQISKEFDAGSDPLTFELSVLFTIGTTSDEFFYKLSI